MIEYEYDCEKCGMHIFGNVRLAKCTRCGAEFEDPTEEYWENVRKTNEETQENIPYPKFDFAVEESQALFTEGLDILCFLNPRNKQKFYVRPVRKEGNFTVLEPLTVTELDEMKIEESQATYNAQLEEDETDE